MITSDLEETSIKNLKEFDEEIVNILVETEKGLWRRLHFDPFKDPTGFQGHLVIKNNEILVVTVAKEMAQEYDELMKKNVKILKEKRPQRKKTAKKSNRRKKSDNK